MSPYETFLATKDYCEGDIKDTIIEIQNLISDIKNNPNRLIESLQEQVDTYCRDNDLCPRCGEKLIPIDIHEEPREYQGSIVPEIIVEVGCPTHNCTFDTE